MIRQAMTKNSLLLGAFAISVAALLAATELGTRQARADSLRKVQSMALAEIIPPSQHDNIPLDDVIATQDQEYLKLKNSRNIHIVRNKNQVIAFILPARAPNGYGGAIDSIVGINIDGTLAGVRIIQHKETPGLGDKIELKKSAWILAFNGKSLNIPDTQYWKVKRDKGIFDQFTGATITPRAVVASVYNSLLFFNKYKDDLLKKANQVTPLTEAK